MSALILLLPFFIAFVSFFLQSWANFFNKSFGVDVWTRLLEVRHVREAGNRIPREKLPKQFMVDGYFDYPPVFPLLLSYIPEKTLLRIKGFISPFFDMLQGLFVFYLAYSVSGEFWFAAVAQITYVLTPVIAAENSQLTPRSLGYFNFSLPTVALLLHYLNGSVSLYWLGVLGVMFLFLTHRFAMQAFLFLSIFFTFYLNTAIFTQAFLMGFVGAVLLTRGYYLRVLKGHLSNIYFWVVNLDYRYAHQVRGIVKKDTQTDLINRIYKIVEAFSPIAIFGMNPWAFSGFVYIGLEHLGYISRLPLLDLFAAWILFFYALGVVILKVRVLMPIGEGYRYMEMATVPSSILSAAILFQLLQTPWAFVSQVLYVLLLLASFGLILFFQIKSVIGDKNRTVTTAMYDVFAYINKHTTSKKPYRILCFPHQNTTMTVLHTRAQVFVNADNPGLLRVTEVYPQLRLTPKELKKKYKLTHVLLKTGFTTLRELGLTKKSVVFSRGDVILAKI